MNKGPNPKTSESMKGNKNAEKWTEEEAISFFNQSLILTEKTEQITKGEKKVTAYTYHFLGEIARDLDEPRDLFTDLKDKFKDHSEIPALYRKLKRNVEANCFTDTKKGLIKEGIGIVNLKSNYGWTDRIEEKHKGEINIPQITGFEVK